MSERWGKYRTMAKTNGYAKRDADIERLRTAINEAAIALEALANSAEHTPRTRSALFHWVERLRHALHRRKP